jgi:rhodanese-related sulfurtransferase
MKYWCVAIWVILFLFPLLAHACPGGCQGGGDCGICSGLASGTFEEPPVTSGAALTTTTLVALLKAKTPLYLVDCRAGGCLAGRRIPNSIVFNVDSKDEELTALVPDKEALIVLFDGYPKCVAREGVNKRLQALGFLNLLEYPGGIAAWVAAEQPTLDIPLPQTAVAPIAPAPVSMP